MKSETCCIAGAAAFVLIVCAAADAGIDMEVRNGDQITGTLSPATEVETFHVRIPVDARFTVAAKAAKKGPALHVTLVDPASIAAGSADGKSAVISGQATSSGVYTVVVASQNGTSTGDYSLVITWKTPTSFLKTPDLAPGAPEILRFAIDAGATATISTKPGKHSGATPMLDQLTGPDSSVVQLTQNAVTFPLALPGEYVLAFHNDGAADGVVTTTVKIKPPKASKRKIGLTTKVIGSGDVRGDAVTAAVVGTGGGAVTAPFVADGAPGAPISGSSVTIPTGVLAAESVIYIAAAPAISNLAKETGAGPTVFFGPEGTRFDALDKTGRANVTIPFDESFDPDSDAFVVYTRDASGKVTVVPAPYVVDHGAHTVTFATSHFSSFRVMVAAPKAAPGLYVVASLGAADLCVVPGQTGQLAGYKFLSTDSSTVVGFVPHGATVQYDVQTFAGGGASSGDGTPRLQFKFPSFVSSVHATSSGVVYASTFTRVFRIDPDGTLEVFAGTGATGDSGDSGPATSATFTAIDSIVATPQGDVLVCDGGKFRIRRIDASGTISAWAGTGVSAFGTDGVAPGATTFIYPAHMALAHPGGVYVADAARVRRIDAAGAVNITVAGSATGAVGSTGDGGPLLKARFQNLAGVATYFDADKQKELIAVTDADDSTVRLLDPTADVVTLAAGRHGLDGDAEAAFLPLSTLIDTPTAVALRADGPFFLDDNGAIRWASR